MLPRKTSPTNPPFYPGARILWRSKSHWRVDDVHPGLSPEPPRPVRDDPASPFAVGLAVRPERACAGESRGERGLVERRGPITCSPSCRRPIASTSPGWRSSWASIAWPWRPRTRSPGSSATASAGPLPPFGRAIWAEDGRGREPRRAARDRHRGERPARGPAPALSRLRGGRGPLARPVRDRHRPETPQALPPARAESPLGSCRSERSGAFRAARAGRKSNPRVNGPRPIGRGGAFEVHLGGESPPQGVLGDGPEEQELAEIVRAPGLRADAGEPEAAEGLPIDEGPGDRPVDVQVADPELAAGPVDVGGAPRVDAARQGILGAVGDARGPRRGRPRGGRRGSGPKTSSCAILASGGTSATILGPTK